MKGRHPLRVPILIALLGAALFVSDRWLFFYRDNFSTHFPIKLLSQQTFRAGTMPFWNFAAGGGQPLAGNPNTLTFYPDNLLYLLFPAHVAFNLHFVLHLLLGAWLMFALCRELEMEVWPARAAALIYLFSGTTLSSTAFYNLVTAIALLPLLFLTFLRLQRMRDLRAALAFGASAGLLGLAGEPVTIVGATIGLVFFAWFRFPRWIDVLTASSVALAVASPQLIAYSEIAREVERGVHRYSAETVLAASLPWWRLPEIFLYPIWGSLLDLQHGYLATAPAARWPPLFGSLFIGLAALAALAQRIEDRRVMLFRWIALSSLFLALGSFNPIVRWCIESMPALRLFRYPEKFALPMTMALTVLTGFWLQQSDRRRDRWILWFGVGGAFLLGAMAWSEGHVEVGSRSITGFLLATGLLFCVMTGRRVATAVVVIASLIGTFRATLPIDRYEPYREALHRSNVFSGHRVWMRNDLTQPFTAADEAYRARASNLLPLFGAAAGAQYALDRSPDGMYSFFSRLAQERASASRGVAAVHYAQIASCNFIVSNEAIEGLPVIAKQGNGSVFALRQWAPYLSSPRKVTAVRLVNDAVKRIESADFDPSQEALIPASFASTVTSKANLGDMTRSPDTLRFRSNSSGVSCVVVSESYFHAWVARVDGKEVASFPANLDRLGFLVPPGSHSIELTFGRHRTLVFFAMIASALLLLSALAADRTRRWPIRPDTTSQQ